jgi:hypothetical protein
VREGCTSVVDSTAMPPLFSVTRSCSQLSPLAVTRSLLPPPPQSARPALSSYVGDEGIGGAAVVGKRRGGAAMRGHPIGEEEEERMRPIGGAGFVPPI